MALDQTYGDQTYQDGYGPTIVQQNALAHRNGTKPRLLGPDGKPIESNDGFLLPHQRTFAAVYNAISHTYRYAWDEALKNLPENALAMRRDCGIMEMLRERQLATAQLPWSIETEDPDNPDQKEVADGLTKCIERIPRVQQMFMNLLEAIWYGRYGVQVMYGPRTIQVQKEKDPDAEIRDKRNEEMQARKFRKMPNSTGSDTGSGKRNFANDNADDHDQEDDFEDPEGQTETETVLTVIGHLPVNGDKINFTWAGTPVIFVHASSLKDIPMNYQVKESSGVVQGVYTDRAPGLLLADPEWRKRFLIHKHEVDDADYFEAEMAGGVHGVGIRHRLYWDWWLRQEVLAWLTDFLERQGTGLTVFYYEASNPASMKAAQKAAQEYGRNAVIAWPRYGDGKQGAGVERIEVGTSSADILHQMMGYFDDRMRRYVVGQDMSSQTEATGIGGDAQAEFKADTKYKIIKFDSHNLEQTLTDDLVSVLKDFNYPDADFDCRFRFAVDQLDTDKKLDAVSKVYEMGVEIVEDEVRDMVGLSKPKEGDVTVKKAPEMPGMMPGDNPLDKDKGQQPGANGEKPSQGGGNGDDSGNKAAPFAKARYQKRPVVKTMSWRGLDISIEVPKGEVREGRDDHGTNWANVQSHDYGFIQDSPEVGDDGHVDVYMGDDLASKKVFVVDQLRPDGTYDEPKVMIGFNSEPEAIAGYLANYPKDWDRFGGVSKFKAKEFLKWLDAGKVDRPLQKIKPGQPRRYSASGKIARDEFHYRESGNQDPKCLNCQFYQGQTFDGALGTCLLFQELRNNLPGVFELYSDVGPHMYCDGWTAKVTEQQP